MDQAVKQEVDEALSRIPGGMFVLCAQHEERRSGVLSSWVQQVCFEPPMISVAVAKGEPIMPLISESRQFGLCQLGEDERVFMRKFKSRADFDEDPFLGFEMLPEPMLGLPLLKYTLSQIECSLVCHMDVEGDHDLFVGQIHYGTCRAGRPHVHIPGDGR